ncbi:hypothetical protein BDV96DRAFT_388584 [Lophiotrema nucula]|uniref:Uncharacterized protein n=1 Tax=Lophiotrema nucula TaxID=690887 RepID=A0A6A5ZGB6_9PLEO|nr:hypothetical protein BDV96DRAFT_388584 [Lophiotrema nucula]
MSTPFSHCSRHACDSWKVMSHPIAYLNPCSIKRCTQRPRQFSHGRVTSAGRCTRHNTKQCTLPSSRDTGGYPCRSIQNRPPLDNDDSRHCFSIIKAARTYLDLAFSNFCTTELISRIEEGCVTLRLVSQRLVDRPSLREQIAVFNRIVHRFPSETYAPFFHVRVRVSIETDTGSLMALTVIALKALSPSGNEIS